MFVLIDAVLGGEKAIALDQIAKVESSVGSGTQITLKSGEVMIAHNSYDDIMTRMQKALDVLLQIGKSSS